MLALVFTGGNGPLNLSMTTTCFMHPSHGYICRRRARFDLVLFLQDDGMPVEAASSLDTDEQLDGATISKYVAKAEHTEVHRKSDILKIYSTYEGNVQL